ncbi:MAG: ComEC/Rec2 family competence protein [Cyclobacteriaceae bacterium]
MFQWVPYAFVRIALFFIAGILTGIYRPHLFTEVQAATGLITLVVLYFLLSRWRKVNPGLTGLAAIFLAGYLNLLYHTDVRDKTHLMHTAQPIAYYKVLLTEPAEEKANSWKQTGRILAARSDSGEWRKTKGSVHLYFAKADFEIPYGYGDVLLIKGSPKELDPPSNPGEFDYRRFLSFKNIYHQHFVHAERVQLLTSQKGNALLSAAYAIRNHAQSVINTHIDGPQQQAIASALILGVKEGLDNDLTQAYAASGAMHVLAVSGLHVGIIYGIILFLFRPLTSTRKGKWVLAFVSILLLWGYALITGFSPSVLRAVTMFSFVALARPLNYRTNIYNILAVSAFVLLLVNPYLIMSVGFQLSYLAVIGIVYLQPKIYRLWSTENIFLDNVWQITCVSIAAQLATFAVGMLYFHQFPVYFLFSNLFVIPGAIAILITGILLLAGSYLTVLASAIGFVLTWLIKGLNYLVFTVEQLPFSLIENVYLTTLQCWLLILLVVFSVLLLQHRKFHFLVAASVCVFAFGATQWHHYFAEIKPAKLVVYDVTGFSAFEFSHNGQSHFYADTGLINNTERIRFHIRPNRLISGIHNTTVNDSSKLAVPIPYTTICRWNKLTIAVVRKGVALPQKLSIDYLIISKNAIQSLAELGNLTASTIILDSSNSKQVAEGLMNEANSRSLRIHSVMHAGAFVNRIML